MRAEENLLFVVFLRHGVAEFMSCEQGVHRVITGSGVARNFRKGVRQSVSFLSVHSRSAVLPSRPYSQKRRDISYSYRLND